MTPDERDRLRTVEVISEHLGSDLREIKQKLADINDTLQQAKGGWKTLLLVGGASATIGAAVAKIAPFLTMGK